MDFLKQTNFRYIVIIIIIILAVINLCKINSQENFMNLLEDQNLGIHKVTMNDTDQVMFGDKTLTDKLKNLESGKLTLGTDPTGPFGMLKGENGLHLISSNRDVFLMSPSSNATIVSTDGGNSGKLIVEGRADFRAGAFVEGVLTVAMIRNRGSAQHLHITSDKALFLSAKNGVIIHKCDVSNDPNCEAWDSPSGSLTVQGNLVVDGISQVKYLTVQSYLTVDGPTRINGSMNVTGDARFVGGLESEHVLVRQSLEVRHRLEVGGDISHSGTITNDSDRRLKENIKNISQNDKDKVLQLVPKTYNMISDQNKKRYGLIAQEVEELYPELVNTNETDGMKSMNYIELIPLLLEQIKDLKKSVEQIKALINM